MRQESCVACSFRLGPASAPRRASFKRTVLLDISPAVAICVIYLHFPEELRMALSSGLDRGSVFCGLPGTAAMGLYGWAIARKTRQG